MAAEEDGSLDELIEQGEAREALLEQDGRPLLKYIPIHKRTWEDWGEGNIRSTYGARREGEEKKRCSALERRELLVHFKRTGLRRGKTSYSPKSLTADVFNDVRIKRYGIQNRFLNK